MRWTCAAWAMEFLLRKKGDSQEVSRRGVAHGNGYRPRGLGGLPTFLAFPPWWLFAVARPLRFVCPAVVVCRRCARPLRFACPAVVVSRRCAWRRAGVRCAGLWVR
ncbi:hypothetical protein Scani_05370 [Streptomyces caniferus]|uniref:Uncharacterized protein n=1 Tax=Streptomyces caniferus TaxID=285557 RepID=A0A640RZD1_9ACTN|nr:hypothetical protein Scani_05370 [Streptomyces caniferus]